MTAFVLGNGLSRKDIDISALIPQGAVYGCNLVYRDHAVTALVATDRPIADSIQDAGYALSHRFYTRRPRADSGALPVPRPYHGFSSGPIALALACQDHCEPIYLLGFDMGPDSSGCFNNVYAGEEFYKAVGASPTYVGNWTRQLVRVMQDWPQTTFYRVYGNTTAQIAELDRVRNLRHITQEQFLASINNPKGS